MHRPSAREFLQAVLETLPDLPLDLRHRLEEVVVRNEGLDRAQAIRQVFEDVAGA
jgi:predicted Zn-dependent protease with MMP-like domain